MKTKLIAIMLITLFALTACAGAATNPPQPNTLSVSGSGTAKGSPDIATVNIGVMTRNEDATKAVSENNAKMNAIIGTVKELGVDAKDIQTTNFSIRAEQQVDRNGKVIGTTYVVNNSASITVRDLNKVGDVLGKSVSSGANNIHSVHFGVSDPEKLQAQARDKAMANAKAKAEQMAKAAGTTIDKVMTISEVSYNSPAPLALNAGVVRAADVESVPVSAGQFEVSVQVSVVYIIK
jgi:uncharacterized protein YggE